MRQPDVKITPMRRLHIPACKAIVDASEPWKRLGEGIDFSRIILKSSSQKQRCHVCLVEGKPAGFVIFTPYPVFARGGYLRAIAVAPWIRGRGIGTMLLSFAEKAISRNADNIYLCVSSFNRTAQAFYRSSGYRKIGGIPGLIIPGISEYIYWKRLAPHKGQI